MITRRSTVVVFAAIAIIATILAGCGSSSSTSNGKPARGFTTHPSGYTTVTYNGKPLGWGQTITMPQLVCPSDHPYVYDLRYNRNTSFRISPGIAFSDWSWGFDASVYGNNQFLSQPASNGQVRIGLKGNGAYDFNSATYWGVYPEFSKWTLTLNCTSYLNQAVYQGPGFGP